jgi:DUF1365 family protein
VTAATAALYECEVGHTRTTPLRNTFRYRTYLWAVDADDLPRFRRPLSWFASFRAEDHLDLPALLAEHGIDLAGGRVRMLTAARVLGHVFNPLTVHWCHDVSGALVCVVAEVHNTYGGRHGYVIRTDDRGRAETEKRFYVSPFEPADTGFYRLSLPEPGADLAVTITLHRPGQAPFVATLRGRRRPASALGLMRLALRYPLAPLVVTLRIRRQGIGLWLRGLKIVQEGSR